MKLPRPRFTVRRMMVAVAIAGAFLAGLALGERREHYNLMARNHAAAGEYFRSIAGTSPTGFAARIALRDELKRKWENAARYPWFPVTPDPPDPP
jgi:hypothetical protein